MENFLDIINNWGLAWYSLGDPKKAVEYIQIRLDFAQKSANPKLKKIESTRILPTEKRGSKYEKKQPEPLAIPPDEIYSFPEPLPTRTYAISFPQGWYMLWDMYTQSAAKIRVVLKDSGGTYVDETKTQIEIEPPLSHGHSQINGTGLQLIVTFPSSIKERINTYTIYDTNGNPVGYGFNLCVEDSIDEDYNDLYVSMVCWERIM